jgi:hypothetical protein
MTHSGHADTSRGREEESADAQPSLECPGMNTRMGYGAVIVVRNETDAVLRQGKQRHRLPWVGDSDAGHFKQSGRCPSA